MISVQVNDLSGVRTSHLSLLGPAVVKKLITMMETAWPIRPQVMAAGYLSQITLAGQPPSEHALHGGESDGPRAESPEGEDEGQDGGPQGWSRTQLGNIYTWMR